MLVQRPVESLGGLFASQGLIVPTVRTGLLQRLDGVLEVPLDEEMLLKELGSGCAVEIDDGKLHDHHPYFSAQIGPMPRSIETLLVNSALQMQQVPVSMP